MKTPEQIRNMEFQKSHMGGYKQSDIELFLEEMASQIEILMRQKAEAERKLQEIGKRTPDATLSAAGIQNVLVSAQKVAEKISEDAKAEAEGIIAEANLKLTEAEIKSKEIIADAEKNAVLLGQTAEKEAAKIIADAVARAEEISAEAKVSVEIEQKLYDRLKIEVSDFKKKAVAQCSSVLNLINQLPDEIPFDIDRAKEVLLTDFNDPEALLKEAVDKRLADEAAEKQTAEITVTSVPDAMQISMDETPEEAAEEIPAVTLVAPEEPEEADQIEEEAEPEQDEDDEEEEITVVKEKGRGHITFSIDDDDDDDDDDEPRLFFKKKRK